MLGENNPTPSTANIPFASDIRMPLPTTPPTKDSPYNLSIRYLQPALDRLQDPLLPPQERYRLLGRNGPLRVRWKDMWDLASDTFNEHVRCKRCGQIPNQMINHHMREDALRLGNALNKDMMEVHFQYLGQHVLDWLGRRYLEVERKYLETTVAHVDCGEIGWNGNRPEVSFGM